MDPAAVVAAVAIVLAAAIGAAGTIVAARMGVHVKAIRHQLTPTDGRTLAEDLHENRENTATIARSLGDHLRDHDLHPWMGRQ